MRTLVYEQPQVLTLDAAGGTARLQSPALRPRIQGDRGMLRATAIEAKLADKARVSWHIRPMAGTTALGDLQALVTFSNTDKSSQEADNAGVSTFPWPETDVSGALVLGFGSLQFDLDPWGVLRFLQLRLVNHAPATRHVLLVLTQVYADVKVPDWEAEREVRASA